MSPYPRTRPHRLAAVCAAVLLLVLSISGGGAAAAVGPPLPADDPARGMIYSGLQLARTGQCAGLYQVTGIPFTMCTHGPDAPPAGLDVHTSVQPLPARTTGTDGVIAPQALPVCEGDGTTGRRVEVLYIHGSTSRYTQFLETFRTVAEGVDTIYNASAQETGGERHVRFVTETVNGACRPVVRNVQIADSALNANDWAPLLNAVRAQGWTRTDRKYLEFVDAQVFCGIGGFAGDTRKTDANASNNGPEYARADNGCWNAGVAAHELGHNFGAVNNNAPNASGFAHCVDEWDVMCYKDNANTVIVTRCTDRAHDQRLDCNHDDYYHTNPPAGSYLANFYNVADNLFLIRGSAPPPPPPTTFRLVNAASGRCLDDPNSNNTNGTQLIIWTCNGGQNQLVTQNGSSLRILGKCLDAFGNGTANGTRIVLWDCIAGATNQQWTLRTDGSIAGVQSGRCLNPSGGGTANNTPIVLFDCNGSAAQRWTRS
ncbi:MAG TPA: RICIN domain-containing protein [Micromonosporaceae bacterium]|nr:RICIN domain-containing protein [Micromonosporaceae bacterium]